MEAMPPADVAGFDAQDPARKHIAAKEEQRPMHRAYEFDVAITPAHALGDRQRVERTLDDAEQEVARLRSRLAATEEQKLALGFLLPLQCFERHTAGFGEGERGARWHTRWIEGRRDRWPAAANFLFGLLLGHAL